MAFSMYNSSTTYARNGSEINNLIKNLGGDIDRILQVLNTSGQAYNNLKNTIKNNWIGTDADAYLKALDSKVENLRKEIKKYENKIDVALTNDLGDFRKFQNTVSSIAGNIK